MSTLPTPSINEEIKIETALHAKIIHLKLLTFYVHKEFFDIELKVENDSTIIRAHKIVLTAYSEYFLEKLRQSPTMKTIEIKGIQCSTLKLIINFIYKGSIRLSIENAESILRSAVFLKMEYLIYICSSFLGKYLNSQNCLRWLKLSKELRIPRLSDMALNFVYANFEKVTKETEFFLLNENELKDLLFENNSNNNLEELVFLSLVAWYEYDKFKRQFLLFKLLSMVRYHLLTAEFIIENIKPVSTTLANCQLIHDWLRYHLSSKSRTIKEQKITSTLNALSSKMKNELNLNEDIDTTRTYAKMGAFRLNNKMEIEIRIYNEKLNIWPIIKRRLIPLPLNMTQHSLILIDKKIYVVGGLIDNEPTNMVSCIDWNTHEWTDLPPMRFGRCDSQLAALNGHLCVFGGFQKSNETNFVDTVEIFNITTQKWKVLQPLYRPKSSNRITGHNGILYIFDFLSGYFQNYDISTNKWTSKKQPIDNSVTDFRLTGIDNFLYAITIGSIYRNEMCSSDKGFDNSYMQRTTVKRFDLSKNSWSDVAMLPNNQYLIKLVTAIENKIVFIKANCGVVEYNLGTNTFNLNIGLFRDYNYQIFFY